MFFKYLLDILPFIVLLLLFAVPLNYNKLKTASWVPIVYSIILIIAIAGFPLDLATDGDRYERGYFNAYYYGIDLEYKDIGWIAYEVICAQFCGKSIYLFRLITASIYVSSYYFFSKSYFGKNRVFCYLVMATGMLGFVGYGTNVIRQGVAMAIMLFAMMNNMKILFRILLFVVSILFHKSMIIIVFAYMFSIYLKRNKYFVGFWIICFVFSFLSFDLSFVFENIGFVDNRIEDYTSDVDGGTTGYNAGFRLDFIIYSLIPLFFSYYYIIKRKYCDNTYSLFIRLYLLINAIWLLVIRIPYSDRMAYLCWIFIPFITLYPLLANSIFFCRRKAIAFFIMFLFMSVNFVMMLR